MMANLTWIIVFILAVALFLSDHKNENFNVVEGDIIVGQGLQGNAVPKVISWSRWPKGIVPYLISPNLPNPTRVIGAIDHYQSLTNLKFIHRTTQTSYVVFKPWKGGYCWSWIGYTGRAQEIMLDGICDTRSVIHEIGHALGLWHEHTRKDRDKYVKIHLENVQKGLESNFNAQQTNAELVGAYDYASVMHYRWWEMGNGKPTVTKLDGSINGLSNDFGLSAGDIAALKYMYPMKGSENE